MRCGWLINKLWVLAWVAASGSGWADGMVFPEVSYPKIQIPNQQALIRYSAGIEHLVIETSFLGEGTNFAWVVPLPSVPEVKPVSENLFDELRSIFQPELVHRVNPYYAGVLLICGLAFLGARALKDEISWIVDLPLCLFLAVGAGLIGKHVAFGFVALGFALCIRLFARTSVTYAVILLVGTSFAGVLVFVPNAHGPKLINTLGSVDSGAPSETIAGVTVVSVQRAGLFDSTVLKGRTSKDVMDWLARNGYQAPPSAEPAIRQYIERGWVFVASKARVGQSGLQLAALHPLAFTFSSGVQIYPTSLTATANGDCSVDLYVFGDRRATARHFRTMRCERVATGLNVVSNPSAGILRISDQELMALIANSTVGTKLSARLTPPQMASDVEVKTRFFLRAGRRVYSHTGALTIALNLALPLAALGWLLAGASQGAWKVDGDWIGRWRRRSLVGAAIVGLGIFFVLPKVEVETIRDHSVNQEEAGAWSQQHRLGM